MLLLAMDNCRIWKNLQRALMQYSKVWRTGRCNQNRHWNWRMRLRRYMLAEASPKLKTRYQNILQGFSSKYKKIACVHRHQRQLVWNYFRWWFTSQVWGVKYWACKLLYSNDGEPWGPVVFLRERVQKTFFGGGWVLKTMFQCSAHQIRLALENK